jgi:hypothetical protein
VQFAPRILAWRQVLHIVKIDYRIGWFDPTLAVPSQGGESMSLGTILIIILILILLGVIPTWGHSRAWGYGPSGIVGLILIILLILLLLGKI